MIEEKFEAPPWWMDNVGTLRPGQKKRLGDGHLVSFNGSEYMMYDFREKTAHFYKPHLSLAERMAVILARSEATEKARSSIHLPDTLAAMSNPQDWPGRARVWLHTAGFSNDVIMEHGMYWAANMQRVVIPLEMLDGSRGWIARDVSAKPQMKYMFPLGLQRGGGAYFAGRHGYYEPKRVCVVEDPLSALRIAKATEYTDVVCALGTSLDTHALATLSGRYPSLVTWLDPDEWGQRGASAIKRTAGRMGLATTNVVSERDPKLYTDEEIRSYIG